MFPNVYRRLLLMALDPYDLALSKLERNSRKGRDDVRFLSRSLPFDLGILQLQYATELRRRLGCRNGKIGRSNSGSLLFDKTEQTLLTYE
jgi:hypothetical protein